MGHQPEDADQQDQDGGSVLQVVVQFAGHAAQTQQADHLQGAEEAADALRRRTEAGLAQGELRVSQEASGCSGSALPPTASGWRLSSSRTGTASVVSV